MRNAMARRNRSSIFVALALLASAGVSLVHGADKKVPQGSILIADKGKLNILLDGKSIGHEEFEIAPNGAGWVAKGTTHVAVEGTATTVSGTLSLQPDGAPVSYEWTSQADKTNSARIAFTNGVAKMTLQMQGAHAFEQELTFGSPMIIVLDNNLYHQYAVLGRVYDWAKKGEQSFAVIVPQQLTPGTIRVDSAGALTLEGKNYDGLKVTTNDIQLTLFFDANHRLMRLEVPETKAVVVRE